MKPSDFDYPLPEELIAQEPLEARDASRLLVLPPEGAPRHGAFADLPDLLAAGDLLVFNDTKVIPARLVGHKESGGKVELLLVEPLGQELGRRWRAMGQASKPIRPGARLAFGELTARVEAVLGEGFYDVVLDREGETLESALERAGRVPLPPYIRRDPTPADRARYQTVWARAPGSAAAPTAGLHFTDRLLGRLAARGVERAALTLHVGPGTFLPLRGDQLEAHRMHAERYEVPPGRTDLFVRPGHAFRAVDGLVTNFHLPRSTLLVLVCALGGTERVLAAYREAVARRYRFFSYGDAMLVWAAGPRGVV
jgi:S-adenosylmethionine:tRNA ribosyltransferase-isomerase